MNCDYCGKDMPKSYTYEVGGTVDCGCRFKKKKDPNNIEASKLSVALDKANKRIAELEAEIEQYHNELRFVIQRRDYYIATRVPDQLLEWLISKAYYAGAWGANFDQAEAILAKRKEKK